MYWATCPVEATTGAASNAAIVEAIGDDVIMAGSGVDAIDEVTLMIALAISEEAFAAHLT